MRAVLGLGSNLGDRRARLEAALRGLRQRISVRRVSRFHETEPVGGPPQGAYLNAAVEIETALEPHALLDLAHDLERAAGRDRSREPARCWPRALDVDILLCGDRAVAEPDLVVPHPRLHERLFVLAPLLEIVPGWVVPGTGKSVSDLYDDALHEDLHRGR